MKMYYMLRHHKIANLLGLHIQCMAKLNQLGMMHPSAYGFLQLPDLLQFQSYGGLRLYQNQYLRYCGFLIECAYEQ